MAYELFQLNVNQAPQTTRQLQYNFPLQIRQEILGIEAFFSETAWEQLMIDK